MFMSLMSQESDAPVKFALERAKNNGRSIGSQGAQFQGIVRPVFAQEDKQLKGESISVS